MGTKGGYYYKKLIRGVALVPKGKTRISVAGNDNPHYAFKKKRTSSMGRKYSFVRIKPKSIQELSIPTRGRGSIGNRKGQNKGEDRRALKIRSASGGTGKNRCEREGG